MAAAPAPIQQGGAPAHHPLALIVTLFLIATGVVVLLAHLDVFEDSSSSNGVQGSGVAATQTRQVAPFNRIDLAGSNSVIVRVGPKQTVVVHADDNLLRHVTTQVHGGALVIGNTPGSFTTRSPMTVEIGVPSLEALTLSGSGLVSVSGISRPLMSISLPGTGLVHASGTASRLDVTLGGSGNAQLGELVARNVHAVVTGSGQIVVSATKRLDASVPGSGSIIYGGDPSHVTRSVTGRGAITRG